jgi:integrase
VSIVKRKTVAGKIRYGVKIERGRGTQEWVGTFATLNEARKAEAKALLDKPATAMTCDQLAEWWLEDYRERTKASSYDAAHSALKGFIADFKGIPLGRVERLAAERWARENRWRVPVVVTVWNYAVRSEHVARNPFAGLSRKGEGRKRIQPLTPAEVEALASAADQPSICALVLFLAYTGIRIGEAFALEWGDVDFDRMRVAVERRVYKGRLDLPKSNKARLCVLTPPARDALLGLSRESDLIFTTNQGARFSQSNLSWYWRALTPAVKRKVTPHELRHFAAHHLYVTMGLPSRVVAAQLGHDGPKLVEDLYGHGDVGALEEIDRAFANVVPLRPKAVESA